MQRRTLVDTVLPMTHKLTPGTAVMLTLAPLLWAGNAVVGRLVHSWVPPITLNCMRWALAWVILLPLAGWVLRPGSGLWSHWRRFALLGLLGVGSYNALQYLALQTSTPLNVTLVGSSMPLWMLAVGALFFGARVQPRQVLGALVSISGVAVVLGRGDWQMLRQLHLVPGDIYMLIATAAWAWYSWLLARRDEPPAIRNNWAAFLLAQITLGLGWCSMLTATEWTLTDAHIQWSGPLLAALLYVAIGPAVLAYRFWGVGVQQAGPALSSFFANLTPLFAALLSAAFLGDMPQPYHALAFVLIAGGIAVSARR
jgi:drug/metabolite transporter (DMT)-like permease